MKQSKHYRSNKSKHYKKSNKSVYIPTKSIIICLLFLIIVGLVTTTFSSFISNTDIDTGTSTIRSAVINSQSNENDLGIQVKTKVSDDIASTGASTYYYRGSDNSWGATAMTNSADGFYAYKQSSNNTNQFKISTSTTSWDYNYTYVSKGFNGTNVQNIGDYSSDNCYCWQSGTYYILVYYPNTAINSSSSVKICASTTLPNNAPTYKFYWGTTRGHTTSQGDMTVSGTTATFIMSGVSQNSKYYFGIQKTVGSTTTFYNHTSGEMYDNDCKNWQLDTGQEDLAINTSAAGSYTFTFDTSTNKVSVTYPMTYSFYYGSTRGNTAWDGFMTISGLTATYSKTINAGDTKYFAIKKVDDGNVTWYKNNGTMTQDTSHQWTFDTGDSVQDCGITAKYTYNYSFSITGSSVTVTFPTEYTITYNAGGGGASGSVSSLTNQAGATVNLSSSNFTRTGYTQNGWSSLSLGSRTYTQTQSITLNSSMTLYPYWEPNPHTVKVYHYGRSGSAAYTTSSVISGSSTTTYNVNFAASKTISPDSINGYKFIGWSTSLSTNPTTQSGNYIISSMADSDLTLYAYYTKTVSASLAAGTTPIAENASTTVTATAFNGNGTYTYNYYVDSSTTAVKTTTNSTSKTNTPTFSASDLGGIGSHTVKVTITSEGESATSSTVSIIVNPKNPTINSFSYADADTYVAGGAGITPTYSVSTPSSGCNNLYSYSITARPSGSTTSNTTINSSNGTFSSTVPGSYTIQLKAYTRKTISSTNYDSGNVTKTTTVYVKPAITISNFSYASYMQGGTAITPTLTWNSSDYSSYSTSISYSKVTSSNDYTLNVTTGAFYSDVPGTYTIEVSLSVTVSGQTTTVTQQCNVAVSEAAKLTLTYTAKSRHNSDAYSDNSALNTALTSNPTKSGNSVIVTEGNNYTLYAADTIDVNGTTWIFRGFADSSGTVVELGTLANGKYSVTRTNSSTTSTTDTVYALYSSLVSATYSFDTGCGPDISLGGHIKATATATGGSATRRFSYSFVPQGSSDLFSAWSNNFKNIDITPSAAGTYTLKWKVRTDLVASGNIAQYNSARYTDVVFESGRTIIVKNAAPTGFYTNVYGFINDDTTDIGTISNPYLVNLNETMTVAVKADSQGTSLPSNYMFKFTDSGTFSTTDTYTIPSSSYSVEPVALNYYVHTIDSGAESADAECQLYYLVVSPFEILDNNVQKIYLDTNRSNFSYQATADKPNYGYYGQSYGSRTKGDNSFEEATDKVSFVEDTDFLLATFNLGTYLMSQGMTEGPAFFKTYFYLDISQLSSLTSAQLSSFGLTSSQLAAYGIHFDDENVEETEENDNDYTDETVDASITNEEMNTESVEPSEDSPVIVSKKKAEDLAEVGDEQPTAPTSRYIGIGESDVYHTYFGVHSSNSVQSIYFSGTVSSSYRLMARFSVSVDNTTTYKWITMQKVGNSSLYRANVPYGFTGVQFVLVYKDKYSTDINDPDFAITNTEFVYSYATPSGTLTADITAGNIKYTASSITSGTFSVSKSKYSN